MDSVLDIFNNYLRLQPTTLTGKLDGAISKCIYNMIFKSSFITATFLRCLNQYQSVCLYICMYLLFIFIV